jgi:pyrimidine operon attenuation protein/uracil phosphoribosyltransferase
MNFELNRENMSDTSLKSCKIILGNSESLQKLKRMAFQISEDNYNEDEIYLIGIDKRGYLLAQHLTRVLSELGYIKVHINKLVINKKNPEKDLAKLDIDLDELNGKSIIIIDDVANTGKILTYALKPFLNIRPKQLRTLALVDRKHKSFPVGVDYVGLSLATTMKEHIEVDLMENQIKAFLC